MRALDQAFIKAYLQQAGAGGNTGGQSPESPSPDPRVQQVSLPEEVGGGLAQPSASAYDDQMFINVQKTSSPADMPPRSDPTHRPILSTQEQAPLAPIGPSESGNPEAESRRGLLELPGSPLGGESQQKADLSSSIPDSPRPSLQRGPESLGKTKPQHGEGATHPGSRKRGVSGPVCLCLAEILDPKDRTCKVGLPEQRSLEQLEFAGGRSGGGRPDGGGEFPSAPSPLPRPHILPFRGQPSGKSGASSVPRQLQRHAEPPRGEQPEYILEFPSRAEEEAGDRCASEASGWGKKLSQNSHKITLRDLQIPREVCLFEPPSPTLPLEADPPPRKGRGVPELPRPAERPRLNLFTPDSPSSPGGRGAFPAPQSGADGGQGNRLALSAASKGAVQAGEAPLEVRLRSEGQVGQPTEMAEGKSTPSFGLSGAGCQPSLSRSASDSLAKAGSGFCPYWQVAGFHWPKVCLALETKASGALDRVAEAILSAAQDGRKVIGFGSVRAGQGATTLLLAAARRLASRGCRLVLVEADLGHPDLADRLNVAPQGGWADLVQDGRCVQEVLIESQADGITLLPWNGSARPGGGRFSDLAAAMAEPLKQLRQMYELILTDLGGLDQTADKPHAEPGSLLRLVEGLVVVRNVRNPGGQEDMAALRQQLDRVGIPVVGIVDNCV